MLIFISVATIHIDLSFFNFLFILIYVRSFTPINSEILVYNWTFIYRSLGLINFLGRNYFTFKHWFSECFRWNFCRTLYFWRLLRSIKFLLFNNVFGSISYYVEFIIYQSVYYFFFLVWRCFSKVFLDLVHILIYLIFIIRLLFILGIVNLLFLTFILIGILLIVKIGTLVVVKVNTFWNQNVNVWNIKLF